MHYSQEVIKGVSWTSALRISTRILALAKTAVIARLLTPDQFGVYGVALLVLGFLELSTETGVNVFLVQKKDDINNYIDTAWVVSIIRGLGMGLVIFLLAPVIAQFFSSPSAVGVLQVTALIPFVRSFINPAVVKFQKELKFNKDFLYRFLVFLIDTAIAIGLAYLLRTEVSLIWGMAGGALVGVGISWVLVKPIPRLTFDWVKAKEILHRGKWITWAGTFDYVFQHLDDTVVGRLLGTAPLGLYQQAYKVGTLSDPGDILSRVTFPLYSRMADDQKKIRAAFLRTFIFTAIFVLGYALLAVVFAEWAVLLFLGPQWLGAVTALKILAVMGAVRSLILSTFPLFLAYEKQEYVTAVTLVSIVALAIVIVPLTSNFGIAGAGSAAIIGSAASLPLVVYYVRKLLYK